GGFDPQSDSTVRVQAGRLRLKLAEYYSHEGPNDPVVVELLKGSYALAFHVRTPSTVLTEVPSLGQSVDPRQGGQPSNRGWIIAIVALSVFLAASMLTSALLFATRNRTQAVAKTSIPAPYRVFWGHFATGSEPPWVIFSNANFAGRPETGMRYFDASADSPSVILDHYTGVGEVLAVHQLDHVFDLFSQQLRVKRGSLFSLDDAKSD